MLVAAAVDVAGCGSSRETSRSRRRSTGRDRRDRARSCPARRRTRSLARLVRRGSGRVRVGSNWSCCNVTNAAIKTCATRAAALSRHVARARDTRSPADCAYAHATRPRCWTTTGSQHLPGTTAPSTRVPASHVHVRTATGATASPRPEPRRPRQGARSPPREHDEISREEPHHAPDQRVRRRRRHSLAVLLPNRRPAVKLDQA